MSSTSYNIIEALAGEFARSIYVTIQVDTNKTLYNGKESLFMALMSNAVFRSLDYSSQLLMLGLVANDVTPLYEQDIMDTEIDDKRIFMYNHYWVSTKQDFICLVTEVGTGEIVYEDFFKEMFNQGVLTDVEDVPGLINYLVNYNILHEGDILRTKANPNGGLDPNDPFGLFKH